MGLLPSIPHRRQRGLSLVEVLITMVVLAFGLLGLAAFQAKAQVGSVESYQRAQASVLLQDMQARLAANSGDAAAYVTTTALGTGDTSTTDCATLAAGAARDKCEWSAALRGASETTAAGAKIGAMQGARGCIAELRPRNDAAGVCIPALYLVTVAWQGLHETKAPPQSCGKGQYGTDTYRRAMSVRIVVGLTNCH
ncbi:MAG: type IV pilus modification protein PilV [Massilia sp.]